ncbi:MAG: hypothetical protein WC988_02520 [Patescibacteria group bacterium]
MRLPAQTKNFRGYALIEILLAFGVSVVVILAMVSLAAVTVKAATTNKAYAEAGKTAQSQAERLKLLRDTSTWSTFVATMYNNCKGSYCHIDSSGAAQSGSSSVGTGPSVVTYYFTTDVASLDAKEFKYTVGADWNVSNVAKSYKIEGLLSDWRSL